MTLERDTKRSPNGGSRSITSNNIIRSIELFPLRRNGTDRDTLVILFQSPKPVTPFNLEGIQFLSMFKDNRSKIVLSHIGGYEIVFEIPLGEFGDFHCCEDFVVFGVGGAEIDSLFVGEGVVDYVVEDAHFVHFI
jgi:hypothetical protein